LGAVIMQERKPILFYSQNLNAAADLTTILCNIVTQSFFKILNVNVSSTLSENSTRYPGHSVFSVGDFHIQLTETDEVKGQHKLHLKAVAII
jgi:hypothetical protein